LRPLVFLLLGFLPTLAGAEPSPPLPTVALTPTIGVTPKSLDFGFVPPGSCSDHEVVLRNAVADPESQLIITDLVITAPFALVDPPSTPFSIAGDGSQVPLTIEYCASGAGPHDGMLTIHAARATNTPLMVPLSGSSTNLPPICDAGGPYTGYVGYLVAMTGAGSSDPDGSIVTHHWDFGDGQTAFGVMVNHPYDTPGSYIVTLTVIDNHGATRNCATIAEIDTNTLPTCDAGGPYQGTVGQPIAFEGSGSSDPDGTIVAYDWQFGDCTTSTEPNPTHIYTGSGSYAPRLCVTDDDGMTSCCNAQVVIIAPRGRVEWPLWKGSPKPRPSGANPLVQLPLHAALGCEDCGPPAVDCEQNPPTVDIPPNTTVTIYLMAYHYNAVIGVQTAFAWDPGWTLSAAVFDCLPGQLSAVVPAEPGGPTAGTVATAFNCMTSGDLLVIGRLLMTSGASGCLGQVESSYPFGTCVLDCSQGVDPVPDRLSRLGKICVSNGGIDACAIVIPAVQPATWGQVKATYR
jgi:PKD repeat protein